MKRRRFAVGILIVLLMILAQQLLWGKLFPYSPVKIGFTKHELSNVVVYLQDGSEYSEYPMIDTLIRAVEKFHGLLFERKPELLVFHDSDSYFHCSITKARFCAYPNGSLVVSPWAVREVSQSHTGRHAPYLQDGYCVFPQRTSPGRGSTQIPVSLPPDFGGMVRVHELSMGPGLDQL